MDQTTESKEERKKRLHRERSAARYAANKDEAKARMAAWRAANPDRCKANAAKSRAKRDENWDQFLADERRRYAARADQVLARIAAARAKAPEKSRAVCRRHYRANPEAYAAKCATRKATKLQATPAWGDRKAILAFFAEARRLTAETGVPYEVDHIVPLQGKNCCGLHVEHNLRVVTREANRRKGAKLTYAGPEADRPGLPSPFAVRALPQAQGALGLSGSASPGR